MKTPRIGIVGAAGTGKSSVAKAVAEKLKLPLIEAKSITREILVRDGYDYGSGIQVERFLSSPARQTEIMDKTFSTQTSEGSWIADRTVVDLSAYAVAELHDDDLELLRKIFYACRKHASVYTHIFLCPWHDIPVQDNHKRTLNPWYQFQIHALVEGIMDDWGLRYDVLASPETDGRVAEIIEALSR